MNSVPAKSPQKQISPLTPAQLLEMRSACERLAAITGSSLPPNLDNPEQILAMMGSLTKLCVKRMAKRRQDEKELRRVRHELENVERLKSRFIRNVSHELRTPLASIDGFAKALLRMESASGGDHLGGATVTPATRCQFLQIISQEAQRLAKLIEDVLDLSDIESQRRPQQAETFAAKDLFNEMLKLFDDSSNPAASGERIAVQNIAIRLNPLPDGPMVYADRQAVIEILRQLLINAQKFSQGKEIVMGAELVAISPAANSSAADSGPQKHVATAARLFVKDRGIGIARSELKHIFDKFYRAERTEVPGTGVGLSIVRSLAQQNNGQVWADSVLGKGSTFYVLLPSQAAGT